jgi:ketosteroid isomerase-like protein
VDLTPPTTRSATSIVATLFDIIDSRRWTELASVFADDCVYHRPGYQPMVGLDRISHFYQNERVIAEGSHLVERVLGLDDTVACWGRFRGRSRTGQALDEGFADTYAMNAGLITARRTYFYRPAV